MRTIQITGKSGPDGVLHVYVPVGSAETEFEIILTLRSFVGPLTC